MAEAAIDRQQIGLVRVYNDASELALPDPISRSGETPIAGVGRVLRAIMRINGIPAPDLYAKERSYGLVVAPFPDNKGSVSFRQVVIPADDAALAARLLAVGWRSSTEALQEKGLIAGGHELYEMEVTARDRRFTGDPVRLAHLSQYAISNDLYSITINPQTLVIDESGPMQGVDPQATLEGMLVPFIAPR